MSTARTRRSRASRLRRGRPTRSAFRGRFDPPANRSGGFARNGVELVRPGLGTCTTRSKRSSNARESFSPYAASFCGEQRHSAAGSPRAPHGQRFIVATRTNRAGKTAWPATRAIATTPSSSGWRSASSTGRWNSGSSSRSSTPWCARLASPGRGPGPAAHDAAARRCDAELGTAGTVDERVVRPEGCPATEWIRVTSSASSSVSGGRRPGSRRASIVLPVPGGPARRRLWRPAAAISSARRARAWPRTSPGPEGRHSRWTATARGLGAKAALKEGAGFRQVPQRDGLDAGEGRLRGRLVRRTGAGRARPDGLPRRRRARPAPGVARPSRASSPIAACSASVSGGICREAASTASAIGRS